MCCPQFFQIPVLVLLLWIALVRTEPPPPNYLPPNGNGKHPFRIFPYLHCRKQYGLPWLPQLFGQTKVFLQITPLWSIFRFPDYFPHPCFLLNQILFLGRHPDSDQVPGSSYLPPENGSDYTGEEEYIFYPPGMWIVTILTISCSQTNVWRITLTIPVTIFDTCSKKY